MLTLKAKDSESSENEPIIETDIFQSDADPSDSPYSQEYFDLMDMIDNTGKQIEYYKMVYTAEIDGLAKRRHSLKTHFLYNVVFLICRVIRAYIIYQINVRAGFMTDYLQKHDIHTMIEEEAYCRKILQQMLGYETTLAHITKAVPKTTTEINAAMSEISAMNFDIKDFHYNAGRTIK